MAHTTTASDERSIRGTRRVCCAIEIDAGVARVFEHWSRFEELPLLMGGVRRTKRIDERRILWDADVSGCQIVWEAEITDFVPPKRIRWKSRWGAPNSGEVCFEELPGGRTLVTVDLWYQPRGLLEKLATRLDLVGSRVRRDLLQFRDHVERLPPDGALA